MEIKGNLAESNKINRWGCEGLPGKVHCNAPAAQDVPVTPMLESVWNHTYVEDTMVQEPEDALFEPDDDNEPENSDDVEILSFALTLGYVY